MDVIFPILKGAFRSFDIFGSNYKSRKSKLSESFISDDTKAMYADWDAVGQDLLVAMKSYEQDVK